MRPRAACLSHGRCGSIAYTFHNQGTFQFRRRAQHRERHVANWRAAIDGQDQMGSNATRSIAKFSHVIPATFAGLFFYPAVFFLLHRQLVRSFGCRVGPYSGWSGRRRPHPHRRGQPASATPIYDFQLGFRCFSTIARTKFARNTAAPTGECEKGSYKSREQRPGLTGIASGLIRATQPVRFQDEYDG